MLIPETVGALRKDHGLPAEDEHLNRLLFDFFCDCPSLEQALFIFGGEHFAQSVSFGNEAAAGCRYQSQS